MIRFLTVILIIYSGLCLAGCSHKDYPSGTYRKTHVTADGDLDEWERPLRFTSNGGMVQYNVTNDNDNIYIALETHDDATVKKILRAGVNIYIDAAGGESKKTVLRYPLPQTYIPAGAGIPDSRSLGNGFKHNKAGADSFSIAGFGDLTDGLYPSSDKTKLILALKISADNSLAYEAVIPLRYIFPNTTAAANTGRQIAVGIVVNAMKADASNHSNTNNGNHTGMSGGRSGGSGGMRGGGRGGGGNYHRNNSSEPNTVNTMPNGQSSLTKQDSNWYRFKLAGK